MLGIDAAVTRSCPHIHEFLAAYTHGTLSLPHTRSISTHLKQCVACRAAADGQQVVWSLDTQNGWAWLGTALTLVVVGMLLWPRPDAARPAMKRAAPVLPARDTASRFVATPGAAYYVRLHVSNHAAAHAAIAKILADLHPLQAEGPYAHRYYLTATPEQLATLLGQFTRVGDPDTLQVGTRQWFDGPAAPNACAATLDLFSGPA